MVLTTPKTTFKKSSYSARTNFNAMDLTETPLCVLSQAAALVETSSFRVGEETNPKVTKEGRCLNLKRTNDKQELPSTPPGKMRLTKSFSPHPTSSLSSDPDEDRDTTDSGDCSSPLDFHTERSSPLPHPLAPPYRDVPGAFVDTVSPLALCRDGAFPLRNDIYTLNRDIYQTVYRPVNDSVFDYDQPLDMSKKSRKLESPKSMEAQDLSNQQQRPSVITCASALLHAHCSLKDPVHRNCSCSPNHSSHSPVRERHSSSGSSSASPSHTESIRPGHRREISSGMCDPVIDEHFRRSLGKDYQEVFSSSSTASVSITVDDHFAKALGDTWLRLQQTKGLSSSNESPSSNASPSRSSPPSSLMQQQQGIVSS